MDEIVALTLLSLGGLPRAQERQAHLGGLP